jgi:hypothetical protein
MPRESDGDLRLGYFYASRPEDLERAGAARRPAGDGVLHAPDRMLESCQRAIEGAHILHVPARESVWTSSHSLEVHFTLSREPPSPTKRPHFAMVRNPEFLDIVPPMHETPCGWTGFRVGASWLQVGLALVPGRYKGGKCGWLFGGPRRGDPPE